MSEQESAPFSNRNRHIAITFALLLFWAFTYLAVNVYADYATGLFIWLPVVLGAVSTLIYGYKSPLGRKSLFQNAVGVLAVYCLGLLFFAWEGLICLIMALPIGVLFTYVGHRIGWFILKSNFNTGAAVGLLLVSVPSLMAFQHIGKDEEQLRSVVTSIEIAASPEAVWKNVIAFPQLKDPTEFVFKTGIAYPINAQISGRGVGAVRHCNFSTGSFVEPITVWNEPHLLRFSVADQPEPMKELSFYDIHPNHLHGYWVSRQGQFRLTQLPNGHTLLEGTTWYSNRIKPNFYWSLWSDYIVHKIHQRVLEHIKEQAERENG